jgi:methylamine dehydrogenase heavy chain
MVTLDDDGHESARVRSQAFFDPKADPVTEKAVRYGNKWVFVSFDGIVHTVDVSGPDVRFEEPWPLLSTADHEQSWRIGGMQHLAVHQRSGRLYALVHRGGPDTHKEPGEEVWIYDLAAPRLSASSCAIPASRSTAFRFRSAAAGGRSGAPSTGW